MLRELQRRAVAGRAAAARAACRGAGLPAAPGGRAVFILPGLCVLAPPDASQNRRRRKTVRLLLANLVIFLLCFVPYNATLAVYGLLRSDLVRAGPGVREQVRKVLMIMVLLAGANCVLDPLVYYFSAEGFRNTLRGFRNTLRGRNTPLRAHTSTSNGNEDASQERRWETPTSPSWMPPARGYCRPPTLASESGFGPLNHASQSAELHGSAGPWAGCGACIPKRKSTACCGFLRSVVVSSGLLHFVEGNGMSPTAAGSCTCERKRLS